MSDEYSRIKVIIFSLDFYSRSWNDLYLSSVKVASMYCPALLPIFCSKERYFRPATPRLRNLERGFSSKSTLLVIGS